MSADAVRPRLFETREARLAPLDSLARPLWLGGLTNSQGALEPRLAAVAGLRAALVDGSLPPAASWPWPAPALALPLAQTCAALELPGYCAGQPELADTVLMSLLFHLDFIVDYQDRGDSADEAAARALAAFAADWQDRCGEIDELKEVFGLLPDGGKNTRWDQIRGLLRAVGWQDVLRIRKLLESLPELAGVIRRLGRARQTEEIDESSRATVEVMEQAQALQPQRRSVRVPDLPGETRGIQRSDRIARMLPAEALLLGHPRLRLVWHARRAERALLCYEDDDRMEESALHAATVWQPQPEPQPEKRLEMGPILVCVDTSGSMQGGAEAVAKATVLEAMRTAHAQKRPCHLFAFGGPDEVVEMELTVDADGIARVIHFLGQAFRGGTDICGPLEKTLKKLEETNWQLADLLLASDGEFGATPDLVARLERAKSERGLRVQAVLIGDRETIGLLELADDIHWVSDWRRFGSGGGESPLPSSNLTAMYFPGALRNPETRQGTVSAATASVAVRAGLHRGDAALDPESP